eukprot:3644442-Ditylum_brightwellii.AAC.1
MKSKPNRHVTVSGFSVGTSHNDGNRNNIASGGSSFRNLDDALIHSVIDSLETQQVLLEGEVMMHTTSPQFEIDDLK